MNKKIIFLVIGLIISTIFFVKIQSALASGETITVISPNGGEVWHPGETQRIRWSSSNVNSVQIYLYDPTVPESGGTIYVTPNNTPIAASLGYYDWVIPSLSQLPAVGGTSYKIRVQDASNANIQDSSDAIFSIVAASAATITVTSPNGGEQWQKGNAYQITWSSVNLMGKSVKISLYKSGLTVPVLDNIGTAYALTGSYIWTVPTTLNTGTDYKIAVIYDSSVGGAPNESVVDYSNNYFSIVSSASLKTLKITVPNGGEILPVYYNNTVAWETQGVINKVNIYYISETVPTDYNLIVGNLTNTGIYSWLPGSLPNGKYKIRIVCVDTSDTSVFDESDNYFTLYGASSATSITIVYPNGGETLLKGNVYTFRWTQQGMSGKNVRVALYQKDLTPPLFENVAGIAPAESGWVSWAIPTSIAAKSNYYKIAVIYDSSTGGVAGQSVVDYSDNFFSISEAVTVPPSGCLHDNTLIKLHDDPKVYIIINCQKKWIQTAEEFKDDGYKWEDVKETSSPVLQAYSDYLQAASNLLRAIGQERVYKVVNGKLLWVPTISAFNAQGLKWSDIQSVPESEINNYQKAKLLKAAGDQKIYYITNSGLKRHILNEQVFNSYNNKWNDVVSVSGTELNAYPDNNLIKQEGDNKVYKLESGQKRWIKTAEAFNRLKYDWNKVAPVNSTEVNVYPTGTEIE